MTTLLALAEPVLWAAGLTAATLAAIYAPHWLTHRLPASEDR